MNANDVSRRLVWYGILLFFLGLVEGMFIQSMRSPRLGLSAHVGAVMSGMFLAILGLAWHKIHLTPRAAAATFWLALYGMYGSAAGVVLAAVFGAGQSTPIAGAGFRAAAWQEAVVNFALTSGAIAALVTCMGVLWGLRRQE
jgi:hydroxylaminobenzene mutase